MKSFILRAALLGSVFAGTPNSYAGAPGVREWIQAANVSVSELVTALESPNVGGERAASPESRRAPVREALYALAHIDWQSAEARALAEDAAKVLETYVPVRFRSVDNVVEIHLPAMIALVRLRRTADIGRYTVEQLTASLELDVTGLVNLLTYWRRDGTWQIRGQWISRAIEAIGHPTAPILEALLMPIGWQSMPEVSLDLVGYVVACELQTPESVTKRLPVEKQRATLGWLAERLLDHSILLRPEIEEVVRALFVEILRWLGPDDLALQTPKIAATILLVAERSRHTPTVAALCRLLLEPPAVPFSTLKF